MDELKQKYLNHVKKCFKLTFPQSYFKISFEYDTTENTGYWELYIKFDEEATLRPEYIWEKFESFSELTSRFMFHQFRANAMFRGIRQEMEAELARG